MCLHVKKLRISTIFIFIFLFLINAYLPAWAQNTDSESGNDKTIESPGSGADIEPPSEHPSEEANQNPKKITLAGEKAGQKIDYYTKQASSHIGGWINAKVFADVTWFKLIVTFLLIFVVLLIERIVRSVINRKRSKTEVDKEELTIKDLVLEAMETPLSIFIWIYGIYIVTTPLLVNFREADGTNLVHAVAQKAADLGTAIALVWFIFKLVSLVDYRLKRWAASTENTIDDLLAPLVGKTLRVFIIIIGSLLILQNLTGIKIGPLLASLGIGGIAVAFAARDSIANFFGTLTILFDKPFQIGERILLDKYDGVIESVGFRSTRIRTLSGHLVTIPNEKIVNSGLENISKRPHIRWLTNITITYDTPPEKIEKAVSIIKEILDKHEGMHPDFPPRVFFNGFNEWSLNILVIAWYHPALYWDMQAWLQQTCLAILKRFNDEGIDFAFPSRTVHLANDDKRQLKMQMLKGDTMSYNPDGGSHD